MIEAAPAPAPPPNQWCRSRADPHPYDVVTGDPRIDKQIAIHRGLYPKPWWRRLFGGRTVERVSTMKEARLTIKGKLSKKLAGTKPPPSPPPPRRRRPL